MPPKVDRAEAVFDAVQSLLDTHHVERWKQSEMDVLLSMLGAYYEEVRTHRALAKHPGTAKRVGAPSVKANGPIEADEEDSDDEEVDEEELEAKQREAAVAEVDRGLARLRGFLQKQLPFDARREPARVPYAMDAGAHARGEHADETSAEDRSSNAQRRPRTEGGASVGVGVGAVKPVVYPIDAFLYLEEDIEEFTERGLISRNYCADCGSARIEPTEFITHSFSQDQLVYLSCFLLPALAEEGPELSATHVVDVGSRLGVVLWACCLAAQQGILQHTLTVTGVEVDSGLAGLQQRTGTRFFPRPIALGGGGQVQAATPATSDATLRWSVVESDCFTGAGAEALARADVLILHNVFEYFCTSEEEHLRCWLRLRALVKRKGQVLVCAPSMEESLLAFSEAALEACGILPSDERGEGERGAKRGRDDSADADAVGGEDAETALEDRAPTRKEVAVARWMADYVEPIDEEVEELSVDFVAFRTGQTDGEGGAHDSSDEHDEHDEAEGDDHGHSHGHHGGLQAELIEQIRNIWAYKVK